MLEKRNVLETFIKAQEEKIERLKQSSKSTQQSAREAVGSMVSWSDTTKFQQSNLALRLKIRVEEIREKIKLLKSLVFNLAPTNTISIGALFSLRDINTGEVITYFLVQRGEGDFVEIDGQEVIFISVTAPIVKVVIGKKKSDMVSFRDRVLEIVEVQ